MSVITQPEKVDMIINSACTFFGFNRKDLARGMKKKSPIGHHKRLIVPLLYDNTNLNFYEIGRHLGYASHSNTLKHYHRVKEEVSGDMYGYEKTKQTFEELKKFIGL